MTSALTHVPFFDRNAGVLVTPGPPFTPPAGPPESWLRPSGGDDTDAINSAIVAGRYLGVGTFLVAGVLHGVPRGQGAALTRLTATTAAARLQHGNTLGLGQDQTPGTFGGFAFDGAGIAGATIPMFTSNVVFATYNDMQVTNGVDTAAATYGQNCLYINCTFGAAKRGLVLDQGCGGNVYLRCEIANCSIYQVEIRQSLTAFTGSAYSVPTFNTFQGCILEGGFSGHVANLHISNGEGNTFSECQFAGDGVNTVANVLVDQTGQPAVFPNYNANTYLRNCSYVNAAPTAPAIKSPTGALYGSFPLILQGDQTFGSPPTVAAIQWDATSGQIRQDGTDQGYTILYSGTQQLAYAPYAQVSIREGDTFQPADLGLKFATCDPAVVNGAQALNTSYIYLVKVFVPRTTTVSKVLLWLTAGGTTLTNGNLAGVYDSGGVLWCKTADQVTAWASGGLKAPALTAAPGKSLTLPGGSGVFYWVALLSNGAASPSFASSGTGSGMPPHPGYAYPYAAAIPGAVHRFAYPGNGYTTLPSLNGLTLTDAFLTGGIPWVGLA